MPDFTTFGVMPFFDMLIDGQQAFGVRRLVWLFGAFAHGHYLATGGKFGQVSGTTVRPQTMQLYTRTGPPNEKTRPKPRFSYKRVT
ncbi:hypothetical protein D3C76_1142100 [compost metagenome]